MAKVTKMIKEKQYSGGMPLVCSMEETAKQSTYRGALASEPAPTTAALLNDWTGGNGQGWGAAQAGVSSGRGAPQAAASAGKGAPGKDEYGGGHRCGAIPRTTLVVAEGSDLSKRSGLAGQTSRETPKVLVRTARKVHALTRW